LYAEERADRLDAARVQGGDASTGSWSPAAGLRGPLRRGYDYEGTGAGGPVRRSGRRRAVGREVMIAPAEPGPATHAWRLAGKPLGQP
jgi:hypothetical protein